MTEGLPLEALGLCAPTFFKELKYYPFSYFDDLVKSHNFIEFVIPAKAGIQGSR